MILCLKQYDDKSISLVYVITMLGYNTSGYCKRTYNMKIVVTGSTGFIGSHLSKKLKELDHEVIEWDRAHGKDIKDFSSTTVPADVDFVVHLAAIADVRRSLKEPELYWTTNVEYSKKIFDLCYKNSIPVVYALSLIHI